MRQFGGSEVMEAVKACIAEKKYREALKIINKVERVYPEYFKAVSFFRGQTSVGLEREIGLIEDEESDNKSETLHRTMVLK